MGLRPLPVILALICCFGNEGHAEVLSLNPGATAPGVLAVGQTKNWQLNPDFGTYIRISITAPDATLNARLMEATGKIIQESTSIGGTGGPIMLAWISGAGAYRLSLKVVGKYPPQCSFQLNVVEYRPAKPGEDPQAFPLIAAENLILRARKLISAKRSRDALPVLEEALGVARQLDDRRLQAQALYGAGMAHYYLGDRQEALDSLKQALGLQRALHQPYEIAITLNNLATVEQLLGNCRAAVHDFKEASELRDTLQDEIGRGYTLLGLANAYYCVGESQQSLDSDLRALRIWRDLKDESNEAETQNTLGVVYLQMGDWENSRRALNAALALWRRAGNRLGEGNSTYNLGLLDATAGRAADALQHEERALTLFQEIKDRRGAAYALEAIGQAYGKKRDHDRALESFEQARTILEQIGERYEEGYLWQALGVEYATLGIQAKAGEAYDRALALEKQVGDSQGQAVTLFRLAQFENGDANTSTALSHVNEAIALVEQSRKQVLDPAHRASYLASKREMYAFKVALLMHSGDSAGAFETSDAAHARSLLDEIAEAPNGDNSDTPRYSALAKVQDVQSRLDGSQVLIEYLVRNDASYGWAITKRGIKAFPLPERRQIDVIVRQLYEAITARNKRVSSETLESRAARLRRAHAVAYSAENRLNAVLFGSIPVSFRKPHMLIVPDGPLYLVPFAVLPTSAQADIAESPSASVFLAKETAHYSLQFTPLLVIADPAVASNSLPELEFAHRDTAALANFVPASEIKTLEKEKASSADFQREDLRHFGLIHIAAHAVVDMNHPADSGVILSDGKLSSSLISTLSINARLVTLSACDTALGREVEGEGIMSLSRAFLYAGARAVLSTLWPIDDQATSAFMQSFYASLLKKKMSAPRALREAQLHMKAVPAWSDPFYWAAFTLQGDSD